MTQISKPLIVANWKMHGNSSLVEELLPPIINLALLKKNKCEVVICPPFTLLNKIYQTYSHNISLGAQDCHFTLEDGAYTGDISAKMLKSLGCTYVILGHSERRKYHNESNELIYKKATAAHLANLKTIICVGESIEAKQEGKAYDQVYTQLKHSLPASASSHNTIIAYEPIWAIGTGQIPAIQDIINMHNFIDEKINNNAFEKKYKLLYGGSVKAENADKILKINNLHGLLVGSASLVAKEFCKIIEVSSKE